MFEKDLQHPTTPHLSCLSLPKKKNVTFQLRKKKSVAPDTKIVFLFATSRQGRQKRREEERKKEKKEWNGRWEVEAYLNPVLVGKLVQLKQECNPEQDRHYLDDPVAAALGVLSRAPGPRPSAHRTALHRGEGQRLPTGEGHDESAT